MPGVTTGGSAFHWKTAASGLGASIAVAYGIELSGYSVLPIPYQTSAANIAMPLILGVAAGTYLQNSYMGMEMTAAVAGGAIAGGIFGFDDMKTPLALGAAAGLSMWLGEKVRGMMS